MSGPFEIIQNKFPYLPSEKLMEMLGTGEFAVLEEGEVFIRAGESTRKVALVVEGLMRNYITNQDGEEVTVFFAAEMSTIAAYAALFCDMPATETCVAVERTVLLAMDFYAFKEAALMDPLYMRVYADMLEQSLVGTIQRIEDFTQKSPEQRYRRVLETQAYLIDRAPLKYLASYLGITPVSLSRIRKRLSTKA